MGIFFKHPILLELSSILFDVTTPFKNQVVHCAMCMPYY